MPDPNEHFCRRSIVTSRGDTKSGYEALGVGGHVLGITGISGVTFRKVYQSTSEAMNRTQ